MAPCAGTLSEVDAVSNGNPIGGFMSKNERTPMTGFAHALPVFTSTGMGYDML